MSNLAIFLFGFGVFSLLLTGLYLSAREFIRASDRPDLVKDSNRRHISHVDSDEAA